jgi:hypothetical protein
VKYLESFQQPKSCEIRLIATAIDFESPDESRGFMFDTYPRQAYIPQKTSTKEHKMPVQLKGTHPKMWCQSYQRDTMTVASVMPYNALVVEIRISGASVEEVAF